MTRNLKKWNKRTFWDFKWSFRCANFVETLEFWSDRTVDVFFLELSTPLTAKQFQPNADFNVPEIWRKWIFHVALSPIKDNFKKVVKSTG